MTSICLISDAILSLRSACHNLVVVIPPVYEEYRGYIVFAFSVCVFVCV